MMVVPMIQVIIAMMVVVIIDLVIMDLVIMGPTMVPDFVGPIAVVIGVIVDPQVLDKLYYNEGLG